MKKISVIVVFAFYILLCGCKKDEVTAPQDSVSNYVKLGFNYDKISPDGPTFQFLKETSTSYNLTTTNVVRGGPGSFNNSITSYDALFTFASSGNTYKFVITNIQSTGMKYYPGGSYNTSITINYNGKVITGTLSYP